MRALTREKYGLGVITKPQKSNETVMHVSPSTLGKIKLNIPLNFWMGSECSGIIIINPKIDGETCTVKWVLFRPFCDVY